MSPKKHTEDRIRAYSYYCDSGMPDFGKLDELRFQHSIAKIRVQGQIAKGNVAIRDSVTGEVLYEGETRKYETVEEENTRLVESLLEDDCKWLRFCVARRREILEQEIGEIALTSIPSEKKAEEINARTMEMEYLERLLKGMINNTLFRDNGKEYVPNEQELEHVSDLVRVGIQVGLGWIPANTTFNQGQYETVNSLLTRLKTEKKKKQEKSPITNNGETGQSLSEITSIKDLLDRHKKMLAEIDEMQTEADNESDPEKAKELVKNAEAKRRKIKIANEAHCKLLCDIVRDVKLNCDHVYEKHADFDLLTIIGKRAVLWELKSINVSRDNERRQLQSALGQLEIYAAGSIADEPVLKHLYKGLTKVVLFHERPDLKNGLKNVVDSLEQNDVVYLLWYEDGVLMGSEKAMSVVGPFIGK